jgi:VPDSG-CTERM motif
MKKLIISVIGIGILNFAQATTTTVNIITGTGNVGTTTALSGGTSYIYQQSGLAKLSVPSGNTFSATISFNNIDLTANSNTGIHNVLYYDVINQLQGQSLTTISTAEANYPTAGTDYFTQSTTYGKIAYQIGSTLTGWPSPNYFPVGVSESWSTQIGGSALTTLEAELQQGYFDIGFNPNCPYAVIGSIQLSWTVTPPANHVPDAAMTVSLLGMSFLGLLAFRRKFTSN